MPFIPLDRSLVVPQAPTPVLEVEKLCVSYRQKTGWQAAVEEVSFSVQPGEAFGLVGESGSGKSSVAMAVLRYLPRNAKLDAQALAFEGKDLIALAPKVLRSLRGDRISAVYQHPGSALNPSLTIGRQIGETLREHRKIGSVEARERAADLLARVRVLSPRRVLDLYPHELSGGMQQRATIAMAIALEPALLVLDEPTTALDASVQAEIVAILGDLRREHRTSLLLISHDIELIRRSTDRIGVMQSGTLVEQGSTPAILGRPQHAYTRALIASVPKWNFSKRDGPLASLGDEALGTFQAPLSSARQAPGSQSVPTLRCRDVSQTFGGVEVLHSIELEIATSETFGLIGESGSGKSSLARIVAGLQAPTKGSIELFGSAMAPIVERRKHEERRAVQMVFQSPDATLNPQHRVRTILTGPLRRLGGFGRQVASARARGLIEAVRLPEEILERRPAMLSGGQRQRVAIARAFAGAPRLVVLDEPTSALDVSVQATVLNLLNDLQRETGASYLFISHDLKVVRYMADHIGVLYRGHLVEVGRADDVFRGPNHPYTNLLMASGTQNGTRADLTPLLSGVSGPQAYQQGCIFSDRCPWADERCKTRTPPLQRDAFNHRIQCWLTPSELVPLNARATSFDGQVPSTSKVAAPTRSKTR